MKFIINGASVEEKFFWNSLIGIASEPQIYRLLDGSYLNIGEVIYHIEEDAD